MALARIIAMTVTVIRLRAGCAELSATGLMSEHRDCDLQKRKGADEGAFLTVAFGIDSGEFRFVRFECVISP